MDPDDPDQWVDESEDYSDLEEERADFEDVPVVDATCQCLMCLAEGENSPHRRRLAGELT